MVIQEETPVYVEGVTQYDLLRYGAMAAKWKEPARDALDTLVLGQGTIRATANYASFSFLFSSFFQ